MLLEQIKHTLTQIKSHMTYTVFSFKKCSSFFSFSENENKIRWIDSFGFLLSILKRQFLFNTSYNCYKVQKGQITS